MKRLLLLALLSLLLTSCSMAILNLYRDQFVDDGWEIISDKTDENNFEATLETESTSEYISFKDETNQGKDNTFYYCVEDRDLHDTKTDSETYERVRNSWQNLEFTYCDTFGEVPARSERSDATQSVRFSWMMIFISDRDEQQPSLPNLLLRSIDKTTMSFAEPEPIIGLPVTDDLTLHGLNEHLANNGWLKEQEQYKRENEGFSETLIVELGEQAEPHLAHLTYQAETTATNLLEIIYDDLKSAYTKVNQTCIGQLLFEYDETAILTVELTYR